MHDQKSDEYRLSNILLLILHILTLSLQVKYYAASDFEIGRYDKAIHSFQVNPVVLHLITNLNPKLTPILINIKVFIKLCIFSSV